MSHLIDLKSEVSHLSTKESYFKRRKRLQEGGSRENNLENWLRWYKTDNDRPETGIHDPLLSGYVWQESLQSGFWRIICALGLEEIVCRTLSKRTKGLSVVSGKRKVSEYIRSKSSESTSHPLRSDVVRPTVERPRSSVTCRSPNRKGWLI